MIKLRDILKEIGVDLPPPNITLPPALHHKITHDKGADKPGFYQSKMDFSKSNDNGSVLDAAVELIKTYENNQNNPNGGYDKKKGKWFPHKSVEGGTPTIAYGHKMLPGENFSSGLTEAEALKLLKSDVEKRIQIIKKNIPNFDSLPRLVKIATINATYRGDLGPKTAKYLNNRQFDKAAREYLNHSEYRTTSNRGVKKRMEYNADVFKQFA